VLARVCAWGGGCYKWTDGRIYGHTDIRTYVQMYGCTNIYMDVGTYVCMDVRMDVRTDEMNVHI
jgi:hypothetical protein